MLLGESPIKVNIATISFLKLLLVAWLWIFFVGCAEEVPSKFQPIELSKNHACPICGMVLVEHPGPKAQIHYTNKVIETFDTTPHMFMSYLQPEHSRKIGAIFVHDMGKADWDHPENFWIDAKKAFFVLGGNKRGPMGEPLVPFSTSKDAENYVKTYGGQTLRFEDVTLESLKPKVSM
jgi:copper chaperone NosL